MGFEVKYEKRAIKSLQKLDHTQQKLIIHWIENNLVNIENPRSLGKALKENLGQYWRYRVGQYRLIVEIKDQTIQIIIVNVGHRKDIYNQLITKY